MRTFPYLFVLLVIATLATMTLPAQAQGSTPPNVGLRPDAPTYALHGPYWVGTRDFVIEDATRPISLTVWYPALNPKGDKEEITYTDIMIKFDITMPAGEKATIKGHALKDADVDSSGGPYALIVFSHGYGDWRTEYSYLTEHLASYGFVVIALDHPEFWKPDGSDPSNWQGNILRSLDVRRVITYAETLTSASGSLKDLIDVQRIGVMGHSYGGYTALTLGGARINLDWLKSNCPTMSKDDPVYADCEYSLPHEADMATMAGLKSIPTGLWPADWSMDARVKAIASFASIASMFGNSGLAALTVPALVMSGSADAAGAPDNWGVYPIYNNVSSQQKSMVVFQNADHFIFAGNCPDEPWIPDSGYSVFCSDPVWDMYRAHDLINHFTTAFMLDALKGDKEAHRALLPEAVTFAGIEYKTTMK